MTTQTHSVADTRSSGRWTNRRPLLGAGLLLALFTLGVVVWQGERSPVPNQEIVARVGEQPAIDLPQAPMETADQPVEEGLTRVEFTLRTAFRSGKVVYVGVGGEIDGLVNPDLVVEPGTIVRAILVNGDGMTHDLFIPDFDVRTDAIGREGQRTELTFTVRAEQIGVHVYYCTRPGHRAAGQQGRLLVVPIE